MIKKGVVYALSATALIAGSGVFVPTGAWADVSACEASASITDGLLYSAGDLQYAIENGIEEVSVGDNFVINCQPSIMTESLKLNLNGKKIEANVPWALDIEASGKTLTIEDNAGGGGIVEFNDAGIWAQDGANLIINGGTIRVDEGRGRGIVLIDGALTITDGIIEATNGTYTSGGNEYYYPTIVAVKDAADLNVNISGGVIRATNGIALSINGGTTSFGGASIEGGNTGVNLAGGASFTMNSGSISSVDWGINAYGNSTLEMNGGTIGVTGEASTGVTIDETNFTMNDGQINGGQWGVTVFNDSIFTMNGGTIVVEHENGMGVSGNGTADPEKPNYGGNAKLILNAGNITSGNLGVYAPQVGGETKLGDKLEIDADKCGVEIRAGELSVEGATINVDPDAEYRFDPNGSGSTASGVGIAVAQHTTQQTIAATVSGGTFTAPVAFAEGNPQENPDVAEQIALSITGGEFNATNGEPVVASEDVEKFISGGIFNKEINESYIADDYSQYPANQQAVFVVMKTSHTGGVDDTDDEGESDAIAEELGNVADDILGSLHDKIFELTGDGSGEFTTNGGAKYWIDNLGYAGNVVWDGRTIIAALDSQEYDLDGLSDEQRALMEAYLQDGMVPFAAMEYWIDLNETDGHSGGWLGVVTEIPYAITMTYDVSEAPAVPEGMTRTWNVIRLHWVGDADEPEVTILPADYDAETGLISYENDKFSAFIVAYADTEEGTESTEGADSETASSTTASPETGTMTREGASATTAALITSIAVGILVSAVSFAVLIRRK